MGITLLAKNPKIDLLALALKIQKDMGDSIQDYSNSRNAIEVNRLVQANKLIKQQKLHNIQNHLVHHVINQQLTVFSSIQEIITLFCVISVEIPHTRSLIAFIIKNNKTELKKEEKHMSLIVMFNIKLKSLHNNLTHQTHNNDQISVTIINNNDQIIILNAITFQTRRVKTTTTSNHRKL